MSFISFYFNNSRLCEEGHSCTTKTRWVDHPPSRDSTLIKQPIHKHRTGRLFTLSNCFQINISERLCTNGRLL